MVNQETGRKIHVQEGSRVVYPEFNDDQVWKTAGRGCWNNLRWTVTQLQVRLKVDLLYYSVLSLRLSLERRFRKALAFADPSFDDLAGRLSNDIPDQRHPSSSWIA